MARRGVRKYFTKPSKGCKTYGCMKRWRRDKTKSISASNNLSLISSTTQLENFPLSPLQLSTANGFAGFDVSPLKVPPCIPKKSIRVLSLFDGISTGYYTLHHKLRLDVEVYYSSEICPDAIRVQKQNFHENIVPLGSVCNLTNERIDDLGQIDLLIGGSPCEELSLANPKRKGLLDQTGSGYLFYDFVRIMRYLQAKAVQNGQNCFWLFENTNKMRVIDLKLINRALDCTPVAYNAAAFVPMERTRNFWGNIPHLDRTPQKDGNIPHLQDFLRPFRIAMAETLPTVTTSSHSQRRNNLPPVLDDGLLCNLWPNELEALFGLPEHFTDFRLSETRRQRLLGKAWSVHVIENILQPLTSYYKTCQRDVL